MEDEFTPEIVRERIPIVGLPDGLEAFAVYPVGRRPEDRSGRLRPRNAELSAAGGVEGFAPPEGLSKDELVWFLSRPSRLWAGIRSRWQERAVELTFAMARCGGIIVKVTLDATYRIDMIVRVRLTPYWAEVAREKLSELKGKSDPALLRSGLLSVLEGVPELADERGLLAEQALAAPSLPPSGSRTRAARWSPYEFALRVAAWWYRRPEGARTPTADEAAAWAFPERDASKETWTGPRRLAVENLLGTRLTEVLSFPDYEIRVRGPLTWRIGSVAVDARTARPWAGLPSHGARLMGEIDVSGARGVFVVENQTTFQEVCALPGIADEWIIIWGKGYATHGLIELLRVLAPARAAIWNDLDADGVRIATVLQERTGLSLTPIGMNADDWEQGPHRAVTLKELNRAKEIAEELAVSAPEPWRELALRIARHPELAGESREQQTLHDDVLPRVPALLAALP
ncbi:Wadjet anti-phage system protein JetD domain-containing protein [Spongiactinospora sp. TRM90649]|uniref:Wadjet anti-phage system protein JetD domain-containing protein n=1 Tax=Spongiactinospora sp. TRM90649 TaxID=3031114 RepID=UPI0023F8E36B|nr:Wadjet anti-phage system protein JetD domain-containing protein [Spongiactinospora sp. TRM90649]MDF5754631.1 DUF2220 family protein [Spongiactinospora sp. TRM90649]